MKEGGEEGEDKMEKDESASQELKTEGDEETSGVSLIGGGETEGETSCQGLKVEEEKNIDDSANCNQPSSADNSEPADVSTFPSEDQNIDPATGECKVVAMDTEEQTDTAETTSQGYIFPDYASDGPLPDQRDTTRLLGNNETEPLASERREGEEVEENKKDDNEITELLGAITLDETESSTTGEGKEGVGGGEMKREDNEPVNLAVCLDTTYSDAALERLKVQVDSVEGSLKRFCTPELLTGSNKFACAVCTKEKARKEATLEREEEKGKSEAGEGQKGENKDMVNAEEEEGDERLAETVMEGRDQTKEVETENDVEESTMADSIAATVDKTPSKAEEGSGVSLRPPSSDEEDEHRPNSINKQQPDEEQCIMSDEEHPSSSSVVDQLSGEELTGSAPGTQEEEELLPGDDKDELPLLGEKDSQGELAC